MRTILPKMTAVLLLSLFLPSSAFADHRNGGDYNNNGHSLHPEGTLLVIGAVLGAAALTYPLWAEDGHPYVEGSASGVLGRGLFDPPRKHSELEDAIVTDGSGGSLAFGMSRMTAEDKRGFGLRGEVVAWHNQFALRDRAPLPASQPFDATVVAVGSHIDGRINGTPVVLSFGGRLGGAYLHSREFGKGALAWDAELVAGAAYQLDKHWALTGQIRGVLLLPCGNNFTVGNGHAVLGDIGLRYTF